MNFQSIIPDKSIALFVRNIWVFEDEHNTHTSLPFFADGYTGLLFQQSEKGLTVNPHNKKMPGIFLYGQTIKPITLEIDGAYQIIIFQFYPFVLKAFWEIVPESINDNCYYLDNTLGKSIEELTGELISAPAIQDKIDIMSGLLLMYFERKKNNLDFSVRQAIQHIIDSKGLVSIKAIAEKENLNIRTFERRFLKETGLPAKQFAKILQFRASLHQLTAKDYKKLTDIVYENGFSDQSHFIRVFRAFTGKTPKSFNAK
ncbi:MAG: AraC family transcriptional regulator [Chitinophagaceae bacterium]|nr:AraC family transcriptional regulator [Chitinophagaceae bacterium]